MYILGILCLVVATIALPVLTDPLPDSMIRTNNLNAATNSASAVDKKDNEEVQKDMVKIASVIIPPPPQLSPFDYSILRKEKADQKQKYKDSVHQKVKHPKKEEMSVIIEKPMKVEIPPNVAFLPSSVKSFKDSEVLAYIQSLATDSAPEAEKKDYDEVDNNNMVKIASVVIPPPPQLSPFDYSILRKEKADQKQIYEDSVNQKAKNSIKEESVILQKPLIAEVLPIPAILPSSVAGLPDSEFRANILSVATDSAPVAVKKDDEEVQKDMGKIALVIIPPPPQLSPFDYSILRKEKADQKHEDSVNQKAVNSIKEEESVILQKPIKAEVLPIPAILPSSVSALPDSEFRANILSVATDSAPVAVKKDDEEVQKDMGKTALVIIPPPPQLSPFDYSILRKENAEQKQKHEDSVNQKAENSIKEEESVILQKPIKAEVLPIPAILPSSVSALPDSEFRANILSVATDSAPVAVKKDDEEVQKDMGKIALVIIPPPPQLSPFDYSILRKENADQKQKHEDSVNQKAENSIKEEESVILQKPIKAEVLPIPAILPSSVSALPDSEFRANILSVATDSAPVAVKKDDEEVQEDMGKIALVIIPPPPQLSPFDYSILRKENADQKQKHEDSVNQKAENSIKEEESVILQKPIKAEDLPIPAILPSSVSALPDSEFRANILSVATDSAPVAEKKDDEEVQKDMAKIASVIIPPPPQLSPFDYSILRKEKGDQKQKHEDSVNQKAENSIKEEESVILQKPIKAEVLPIPAILPSSVSALPDSEVRINTINITTHWAPAEEKKNIEEVKKNTYKYAAVVIPPPPEVPLLDYSIPKNHNGEPKQKSDDTLEQKVENSKTEKEVLILEEPVEVKVEEEPKLTVEPKFESDSKPMEEFKPVEDSKPLEDLKKEPVKPSEDIPVIIKWTVPAAPFLSKLISNYPQLPGFGLTWPYQRPLKSRRPRIIYPQFDVNGVIYTN